MRQHFWTAALVVLAILVGKNMINGCSGELVEPGTPVAPWKAKDTHQEWSSESFAKKSYALLFFATWCSACSRELPKINQIKEANPDLDILLITEESPEVAQNYLNGRNLSLPVGSSDTLPRQFGVSVLLSAVLVNKDGNVELATAGVGSLGRITQRLLKQKSPPG
jgi:thiol-disulfide isomerase/thioredoxin